MKPQHRTMVNVASVLVGLAAIFASLFYVNQPADKPPSAEAPAGGQAPRDAAPPSATPTAKDFTVEELTAFDGKNGRQCYVAVDKTVAEQDGGRVHAFETFEPAAFADAAHDDRQLLQLIARDAAHDHAGSHAL